MAAQTDPAPQQLPYAQDFSATLHSSIAYPSGWQGWSIGTAASSVFEVGAPTADLALIANSTAALNSGGIHNYNGKLGFLNSGSTNTSLVLSISTSAYHDVEVGYTLMTIRNPYNGTTNTRINEATVQYRVGTTGPFATLGGATYATGTTAQTTAVTTPLGPVPFTRTLPPECNYQPVVQLRWVVRDNTGGGQRPSIAVDMVSVNGTAYPMFSGGTGDGYAMGAHLAPALSVSKFQGGNGRGDASHGYQAPIATANIFNGGSGRGDVSNGYTAPPISASIFNGGTGRGDMSNGYNAPPLTTSIFNGGNGRGDVSNGYTAPPISASIFNGGNGRGDVSNGYTAPPISASIFNGGNGRGDVSNGYAAPPITASIFNGGNGRGDVSNGYNAPPLTANIFNGGNGRGDVSNGYTSPQVTTSIFNGGNGRGDVSNAFVLTPLLSSIFAGGNGRGDVVGTYLLPLRVQLALRGFLEGPYDQTANRMRDDLRNAGLLPSGEPYTALGYGFVEGGGETVVASVFGTGPSPNDRIVDWVVVELRDANDPAVVVSSRCALVQRDGDVVDLDGSSPVSMVADPASYKVALRHRNHLGAMTANAYALSAAPLSVDLTLSTTLMHGTQAQKDIGTVRALWAGDVFGDGTLRYTGQDNDRDPILQQIGGSVPSNVSSGVYVPEDVNLDGQVKYIGQDNDRDPILVNIGGSIPTNVRMGQLP